MEGRQEVRHNLQEVIRNHCRDAARDRKVIAGWRINYEARCLLLCYLPSLLNKPAHQSPTHIVGIPYEVDPEDFSEEPVIEPVFAQPVRRERPVYVDREHELRFMNACLFAVRERKRIRSESE